MEYLIKTASIGGMTEEEFFNFCQENSNLRFERNAKGDILIMAPTGSEMGSYNADVNGELVIWNKQKKAGRIFDSNAGFTLPNGAIRAADAAFITHERWNNVPPGDRKKFAHICPDFVIEIFSENDDFKSLEDKMKEWIDNGCKLAWMIHPEKKETRIYRKNGAIEIKPFAVVLDGEDILPGFSLDLTKIFSE